VAGISKTQDKKMHCPAGLDRQTRENASTLLFFAVIKLGEERKQVYLIAVSEIHSRGVFSLSFRDQKDSA